MVPETARIRRATGISRQVISVESAMANSRSAPLRQRRITCPSSTAMQPSVLAVEEGHVILRCRRGAEREFAIALSTLVTCRDIPVALRIRAVSGTIESLRERIGMVSPQETSAAGQDSIPADDGTCGTPQYQFDSIPVEIVVCHGHKVDALEKGFKNTRRLFLTTEDLEIIHATTISDGL